MCVDFIDLNKTCSKDHYPLPSINRLVESTLGHAMVSFLDAILVYHQILMDPEDAEKTTFITDKRVFCYKVIIFGLKNAGATYQRLVSDIFKDLLETIVEAHVDNMVVKSQTLKDHPSDIQMIFNMLDKASMKLNPKKYNFGVRASKF